MTKGGKRDILVGGIVFAFAGLALWMIYVHGADRHRDPAGYALEAAFYRLEGIAEGSPVRLSGVVIGKVGKVHLGKDFRAVTMLILNKDIALPRDSAALIRTDGLLGGKYIDLQPGGDEAVLQAGERIGYTQDAMAVEDLLEMVIREGKAKRAKLSNTLSRPCVPPSEDAVPSLTPALPFVPSL